MMSQSTYDRCLIIFALLIIVLAVLAGCTPETAVSSPTSKQFNEPLTGELSFAERPSTTKPTINLILINAELQADDNEVKIDGRGLETPLLQLNHCRNFIYDGEQLTIFGSQLTSDTNYAVLMDYKGINLSTGGDNTLEKILTEDDNQYQVPLALDTNFTFYTINLGDPYTVNLWQGERNGNNLSTTYHRPVEDQSGTVTLRETHTVTILHNVPLTYRDPAGCD